MDIETKIKAIEQRFVNARKQTNNKLRSSKKVETTIQEIVNKFDPIGIVTINKTKCCNCLKDLIYSYSPKSGGDYCNTCFHAIFIQS